MTGPSIPWPLEEFFSKQGIVPAHAADRRRFARRYFRRPTTAYLSTSLPAFARSPEQIIVYSSDLSLNGIGFIIDRQLYPGERIKLDVPRIGRKEVLVQRCFCVAKRCFCVGGMFDSPIPAVECRGL